MPPARPEPVPARVPELGAEPEPALAPESASSLPEHIRTEIQTGRIAPSPDQVNLLHQGMLVVGVPYSCPELSFMDGISGGSPYGASTLADSDGSRQPSDNELAIARFQGRHVAEIALQLARGRTA